MFFYKTNIKNVIVYLILINIVFVNIVFGIYLFYNYNVNTIYKKLTLYLFIPIWVIIYMLLYSSARQHLVS